MTHGRWAINVCPSPAQHYGDDKGKEQWSLWLPLQELVDVPYPSLLFFKEGTQIPGVFCLESGK